MNKVKLYLVFAIVFSCSSLLWAADSWPNWRGPEFTGVAPNCNPPTVWSETQNIKWKVKLTGDGSDGSPIVWKDKIFFQTAVKTDKPAAAASASEPISRPQQLPPPPQASPEMTPPPGQNGQNPPPPPAGNMQGPPPGDRQGPPPGGQNGQRPPRGRREEPLPTNLYQFNVVCMDRATGKILWEKTACEVLPHQAHHPDHGFVSYSPVTDGKYVWANFGSRGLYCYDFNGNLIWKKDLIQIKAMFGEGGALAIAGDAVIVVTDSDTESWIWAFNKTTGDILWKKQRDEKTTYSTPLVTTLNGQLQIITAGINKIRSYNPKTGDLLWECAAIPDNSIPTPIVSFDMLFTACGGRGKGQVVAMNLDTASKQADPIVWQTKEIAPFVPSPMLYGQRLYVYSGNPAKLSCFDAKTGKAFYDKQLLEQIKDVYASPVGAADKVYCVGREGITYVIKNADTPEVLSVNKLDDGIDATPAIADNEIILKGKQYMYCIAEKK